MPWLASRRDLDQVDDRLHRLNLAEEQSPLPVGAGPVVQQAPGDGDRVGSPRLPPTRNPLPKIVDQFVLFGSMLDVQVQHPLLLCALELGFGDGYEVGAPPSPRHDLVGNIVLGKAEMPPGFPERGVDDGVFDGSLAHDVFFKNVRFGTF